MSGNRVKCDERQGSISEARDIHGREKKYGEIGREMWKDRDMGR